MKIILPKKAIGLLAASAAVAVFAWYDIRPEVSYIQPKLSVLDLSTARGREEYVFKFWKDRGLTDVQAAAVVGNFMGETRMDDLLDPTTVGGWENKALGIEQALGDRKTNLLNFAKEKVV